VLCAGGTNVIPYSHRSTEYMRESGREMLDGNFNPEDVLKVGMPRSIQPRRKSKCKRAVQRLFEQDLTSNFTSYLT